MRQLLRNFTEMVIVPLLSRRAGDGTAEVDETWCCRYEPGLSGDPAVVNQSDRLNRAVTTAP